MDKRIKSIIKNNTYCYNVQIRKCLFWRTVKTCITWQEVEETLEILEKIEVINNKLKSNNKLIYTGWAVRNISKKFGNYNHLEIFKCYPTKFNKDGDVFWKDEYGSTFSDIQIKCEKLFGKECLEPMKLRITIEEVEE